jgi:hypothetical protein
LFYWSCTPDQNDKTSATDFFYDINGLIDEQIMILDSISPFILKKAKIGADEEIKRKDSVDWSDELMLFRSADINKPLLKDSYEISTSSEGNFQTISYASRRPESTAIDKLSVSLTDKGNKPVEIHASFDSKNPLFATVMTLEMHFQTINGIQVLSKYVSEGWQKMVSKDSTYYSIEAELIFD